MTGHRCGVPHNAFEPHLQPYALHEAETQTTLSQFRRSVGKVSAGARAKRLVNNIKLC